MKLTVDERAEFIEETEARMCGGLDGLIRLLNSRILELGASTGHPLLPGVSKARRKEFQKYLRRLERRYYAALQARSRGEQ